MAEDGRKKNICFSVVAAGYEAVYGTGNVHIWRPTLDLCRVREIPIDELYLLVPGNWEYLMPDLQRDIIAVSPHTKIEVLSIEDMQIIDFAHQYSFFSKVFKKHIVDAPDRKYYINLPPGRGHFLYFCILSIIYTSGLPLEFFFVFPDGQYFVGNPDHDSWLALARSFDVGQVSGGALNREIEVKNRQFKNLLERVEQVARVSSAPLLFSGESGTGKSQLARSIYQLKKESAGLEGPLVEVSCAALRGDSALSALFGHVKGAYTNAVQSRRGLLLQAHRGVLFLDEIGEMDLDSQALLVKALEEKTFLPVGADVPVYSDFQLICGTNRSLAAEVAQGGFRSDLFARINLWNFELPPLRERAEDIEANLDFEIKRLRSELKRKVEFHPDAREAFLEFATSPQALWLGNFRDFSSAITRMGTLAPKGIIGMGAVRKEKEYLLRMWEEAAPVTDVAALPTTLTGLAALPAAPAGSAAFTAAPKAAPPTVLPAAPPAAPNAPGAFETPVFPLLGSLAASGRIPAEILEQDYFTNAQLEGVLKICLQSPSLQAAGPRVYGAGNSPARQGNRLSKYLTGHGISWRRLKG